MHANPELQLTSRAECAFLLMTLLVLATTGQGQIMPSSPHALELDLDQYAAAQSSIFPNSTKLTSFTVEAWILPRRSYEGIIMTDDSYDLRITTAKLPPRGIEFKLYASGGPGAVYSKGLFGYGNTPPGIPLNKWIHVAGMFDATTTTMTVAINGTIDPNIQTHFSKDNFLVTTSPRFFLGYPFRSTSFVGQIAEVRISGIVRYRSNFVPASRLGLDPHTKALFHFDEPIGSTQFADSSTSGITLIGFNGARVVQTFDASVAPTITVQPQSQSVLAGGSVTFSLSASGQPAPSYQWQFNGLNILGATTATLTITNLQTDNAGRYRVIVSNSAGSTSSEVVLNVINPTNPAPARLSIRIGARGAIRLSWPIASEGYVLESALPELPLRWTEVTDAVPLQSGDEKLLSIIPAGESKIYRLRKSETTSDARDSITGKKLRLETLTGGPGGQEVLTFTSATTFVSDLEASGSYTYSRSGNTAVLATRYEAPAPFAKDHYELTLNFATTTSGTFSGNQHFLDEGHQTSGVFSFE